jgi:putative ABC transport system permease protein
MKQRDPSNDMPDEGRADAPRDVDEELAFHIEQRVRDYMARGMDEASARAAALERLGDLRAVRAACDDALRPEWRVARWRRWLSDARQDCAFALRSAAASPLFTLLAVLMLALGIGANAAVFGVVKSVLVDALPYPDADGLVRVYGRVLETGDDRSPLSVAAVADMAERQHSFVRTATFHATPYEVIYRPSDGPQVRTGAWVEAGFLEVLGVRPAAGRAFTEREIETYTMVVMLGYDAWRREFGGDPGVVGATIRIDANSWRIVGVMPETLVGPPGDADFWFGMRSGAAAATSPGVRKQYTVGWIGRLRADATISGAQRDLASIASDLANEHPGSDGGRSVNVVSLRESMVGDTRAPLLVLMACAALVLLVTCANLTGALLTRAVSRRREFAVRSALGAGRGRMVRQVLTENTLLAFAGAGLGLLLAVLVLSSLRAFTLTALPSYADLSLDAATVVVTIAVALITSLGIGIVPALSARHSDGQATLRSANRDTGGGARSRQVRGLLVAGQIAVCLTLLVGAGLLTRSLLRMTRSPLGFDPDGVLTFSVKGPLPAPDAARRGFFDRLVERIGTIPGVEAVASTDQLPGEEMSRVPLVRAGDVPDGPSSLVSVATVTDDYFDLMRVPLLHGRTFGVRDAPDGQRAIVISETLVRRYWPGGDAIGARVRLGGDPEAPMAEVVGIVGDVRNDPTRTTPAAMVYATSRQSLLRSSRSYLVRADRDPARLVDPIRRTLLDIDNTVPMTGGTTLRSMLDGGLDVRRVPALLVTAFAVLALLLACMGVYAMFSSLSSGREREFGVRMALGSSPRAIASLVLRQGAAWIAAGFAIGLVGAGIIARALRTLLFDVSPLDPVAIGVAVLAIASFGTIALLIPVRRATRTDPRAILR